MIKVRSESVTWQRVDNEIVCLDLYASQYFAVNAAGSALWDQLVAGATPEQLVARLQEHFELDASTAERDCAAFVSMLRERGLVEDA